MGDRLDPGQKIKQTEIKPVLVPEKTEPKEQKKGFKKMYKISSGRFLISQDLP